jgi:hypothetical protein
VFPSSSLAGSGGESLAGIDGGGAILKSIGCIVAWSLRFEYASLNADAFSFPVIPQRMVKRLGAIK